MASIVVLDGFALNPGDLSWDPLTSLGRCAIYERTPPEGVLQRATEAEILLTNKTPLPESILRELPNLRFVGVLATGYNIVDVRAARQRGIPVANVPAYSTESVAQLVFAHLLNLTHHVEHHAQTVREGRWSAAKDFCYWDTPLIELRGLTMGIVGYSGWSFWPTALTGHRSSARQWHGSDWMSCFAAATSSAFTAR